MKTEIDIFNKNYNFKSGKLTNEFIENLKSGDLFSFHCRDFIQYLGFKRCDKKFREKFYEFLNYQKIKFVITNSPLTNDKIYNLLNAEKIVKNNLDKPCYSWGGETWRQLYNRLIRKKSTEKTFDELVEQQIEINKRIYSVEITQDKGLSGGFNSGCWLIFLKL